MVARTIVDSVSHYSNRLIRVVTVLVDMHMDIAMREAAWEQKRITTGLILGAIGGGLMAMSGVLLHAIALWLVHALVHSWLAALAIITAIDIGFGTILLLAAARRLRGPYMVQTQARLARTAASLMQSDAVQPSPPAERNSGQIP